MDTATHDTQDITAQILHDMLTENTGRHMLDSGGSCGRAWQRNQGRAFENEPEVSLDASYDYLDITLNLYHWLKSRLEYNEDLDNRFQEFSTSDEMDKESWFACGDAFMTLLQEEAEENGTDFGGIYGEDDPQTVNTYNHESLLSQVIQYTYWEDEDGAHVLLQIHGGADVRGGYTRPVFFDVDDSSSELAMFDDSDAHIYCTDIHAVKDQMVIPGVEGTGDNGRYVWNENTKRNKWVRDKPAFDVGSCGMSWDTRGGYWESNDNDVDIKDCEIVKYDEELEDGSDPKPGDGYIFVNEDGVPHCPTCGSPMEAGCY